MARAFIPRGGPGHCAGVVCVAGGRAVIGRRRAPRRRVVAVIAALLAASVASGSAPPAAAGSATTGNACLVSANRRYSNRDVTVAATATSADPTVVELTGTTVDTMIPESVQLELYNLGYYAAGFNGVGISATLTISADNTVESTRTTSASSFIGVTITDPDGVKNTGDEQATTTPNVLPLPDTTWTPTGGDIAFREASLLVVTSHFFGFATARHECSPGSTTDRLTMTPALAAPFETITPASAPVCSDASLIGGRLRPVDIDVPALCSDANGNLDPASVAVVTQPVGGTATVGAEGLVVYTNTDPEVGLDTFTVVVADTDGLASAPATITVDVRHLRFMERAGPFVVMPQVELDGKPHVSTAPLSTITVTNDPSSGMGFTVSAYAVDLTGPGGPSTAIDLNDDGTADLTVPDCEGTGGTARVCIPSANLGWAPQADVVAGAPPDPAVAAVEAGAPSAASAGEWLGQLEAGGPVLSLDEPRVLCSSPAEEAGGTFACDADVFLAVPASAAAETYTGYLVITIL